MTIEVWFVGLRNFLQPLYFILGAMVLILGLKIFTLSVISMIRPRMHISAIPVIMARIHISAMPIIIPGIHVSAVSVVVPIIRTIVTMTPSICIAIRTRSVPMVPSAIKIGRAHV